MKRNQRSHQGNTDRYARGDANKTFSMAPMADLRGHRTKTCAFIAGEDHYACGEPTMADKPYCGRHYSICYRPEKGEAA